MAFELDPASVPLAEVVRAAIRRLAGRDEGTPRRTLVMNDVYLQHRHDPAVATELSSVYGRWISELTLFVEALGEAGWVDLDRDASAIARQVLAYGQGLLTHAGHFGIDENEVEDLFVDGLLRLLPSGRESK